LKISIPSLPGKQGQTESNTVLYFTVPTLTYTKDLRSGSVAHAINESQKNLRLSMHALAHDLPTFMQCEKPPGVVHKGGVSSASALLDVDSTQLDL
jgi:hypothetical protein